MRAHEGSVIALASNQRWSSDGLEIGCWNGEMVRVAFAIDTCDREIIAWHASTGGISGEMVRDLMLTCVERRFDAIRAPYPVQWLADNGSAYAARRHWSSPPRWASWPALRPSAVPKATALAKPSSKPSNVTMPGSNQSRRRDRPAHGSAWIDDYNEHHPHSGLRMRSPREFIRSQSQPAPCPV